MKYSFVKSDTQGMLTLNGKLTIDNAAELKGRLMETMKKTDHLTICIDNVTEVDISCFQLLYSAYLTALNLKKIFKLNKPGKGIFSDTLKSAGYSFPFEQMCFNS